MFQWIVIATGSKLVEEVYKAPDNVLSSMKATEDVSLVLPVLCLDKLLTDTQSLQVDYTFGPNIRENPYHIPLIRLRLTQELPLLVPEFYDEVVSACNDLIPITEGERLNRQNMI